MNSSYKRTFDLSAKKRALLETILRDEGLGTSHSLRISQHKGAGAPPLSFAQQRLWFFDQFTPASSIYNIPVAMRLSGPLQIAVLAQSFNSIMQRHEALRTTFSAVDGQAVQVIAPAASVALALLDLQALPHEEREIAAQRLAVVESQRCFDLARGPLLRAALLRLDADAHVLLLTIHHIISDGWSIDVLFQELGALYNAAIAGRPAQLPVLPIQYADFAVWQRQWLQGAALETRLAYWRQQLANAPALLELPADRPRPAVQTFRGATYPLALSAGLRDALVALSRCEGVTMFMLLLAAFQVLLMRYSGKDDILVGSPIADRKRAEVKHLIGFFVNTLVLRTDMSGNPTFQELLRRVREVCLGAYTHQDLPFEKLVEELRPERNLSFNPLFQMRFVLQDVSTEELKLVGLTTSKFEIDGDAAKVDLSLLMMNTDQELTGKLVYSIDLFDAATIARMAEHFRTLLEGIVANPQQRLADLPLLTDAERRRQLIEWNATGTDDPHDQCMHQLFEAQVNRSPNAIALVFEGQHASYLELNRQANQLAHHLQMLGVGPEVRVGLCLERSPDMLVAVLGILKAGGACVPLDPTYPHERLGFMLTDAQVSLLLTTERLADALPASWVPMIAMDADRRAIASASGANPLGEVTSDNLAYVIYTSGSTGAPKGVLVPHHGVGNLSAVQRRAFDIRPGSCVLQFASLSFDAAVWEICMALLNGATLVLGRQNALMPGPDLLELLDRHAITVATLPPSALAALPTANLPALRTIIVAGEAPAPDTLMRWMAGRRIVNAYGPTETTVCATMGVCPDDGRPPPIGRPLNNTQVYLLDRHLQPVPVGVPGELYIGGVALARGYHNRPDLTAERFIPNPFGDKETSRQADKETGDDEASTQNSKLKTQNLRLYRTGDLARYLPDGAIEYLGRIDQQIKLRGYRIEPGEVTAALARHPAVRGCVVTVRADTPGDPRLVAYLVPNQDERVELWPSVAEYFVYDELLYHAMTNDERRNHAYQVAIARAVKDKVVVEVGTGKDAILARMCASAGARKVYAIELLEESFRQARACVAALGLQNTITIIHGDATKVQLPEPADVCLSEIVGTIGGSEGAAVILNDARRFLRDGGVMIPQRSVTRIAAVTLPDTVLQQPAFGEVSAHYVDAIFDQVGYKFDLRVCLKGVGPADLLSDADVFEDLDFREPVATQYQRTITLTITRDGRLDGFLVWLTLEAADDEWIDILEHEHCWLPVYLPAFYPGRAVTAGDRIEAEVTGTLCANGLNPDYNVRGRLVRRNGEVITFDYDACHFKQVYQRTPFYAALFAEDRVPVRRSAKLSMPALRAYLRERLPDYMLPAAFVVLDALPVTPNGKIDHHALPPPDRHLTSDATYVEPRTAIERTIATIWQEVLHVDKLGSRDNFFDLGGHSLLMVQVHTKLREAFVGELSMVDLFQYPSINALANYLSQEQHQPPAARQQDDEDDKLKQGRGRLKQMLRQRELG